MNHRILFSVIAAAISLAAACNNNGSDTDNPASGKDRTDICSILTIGQTESLDSLEYDANGRVVKVATYAVEDEELGELKQTLTYAYSEGRIESGGIVYTLGKDNLVTGMNTGRSEVVFTYDSDGHLTKAGDVTYTWKDGDLVSASNGYTYTASDVLNPGYWPETLDGMDPWLYRKGYFGKLPKHLPSAWSMRDDAASHQFSCEYEVEGGVLVGCNKTAIHTTGSTPSISEYRITINWKKY